MQQIKGLFRWFSNTSLARSLRFRLVTIVLLACLPAIALLFFTASQQRADAIQAGQDEAERLSRVAADEQGRSIEGVQREMLLLSRLPEVTVGDKDVCNQFMRSLIASSAGEMYADIRVMNGDGRVFCQTSASNPLGPNEDRTFIQKAISGDAFTVGQYRIDPLYHRSILSFATPVHNEDGTVNRALVVTVPLANRSSTITALSLPEGASMSIVGTGGTLLLQEPADSTATIGQVVATPDVRPNQQTIGDRIHSITATEQDVESGYLSALSPITFQNAQWTGGNAAVIIQIPRAQVVRPAETAFRDNLGKLGIAVAVAAMAAWVSADLFVARDGETRKSIVAELYHAYSSGVTEHLDTIVSPDVIDHNPLPGQVKGIAGLKQSVASFRTAFPDGEVMPREMYADQDKVVVKVSMTGTHVGEYNGVPPTGKRMIANGMDTFQFKQGMISDCWSLFGPLVEMRKLEAREYVDQTKPAEPGLLSRAWNRIWRRGRRAPR